MTTVMNSVVKRSIVCEVVNVGVYIVLVSILLCIPAMQAAGESNSIVSVGEGLQIQQLAFSYSGYMYLDGPALEATCPVGRPGGGRQDEDGNVWFGHGGGATVGIGGRCLDRESGVIRPYFGNDYWTALFPDDEGFASDMFNMVFSSGFDPYQETSFLHGAPMRGEGFFLFSDGMIVRKVFKNPEQGNRWWFRRIIGGGDLPLPTSKGATVSALELQIQPSSGVVRDMQVMPDGRMIIFLKGGFYEYSDGVLTCLLGYDDYKNLGIIPEINGVADVPSKGVLGMDGTFYLCTYFGSGYNAQTPCIWRIEPDGQLEAYSWAVDYHLDGPGMASGGHCSHHIWSRQHNYKYLPDDFLVIMGHDEHSMRRMQNGRISTLCSDGEWREYTRGDDVPFADWFHTWAPGPNGTATSSSKGFGHYAVLTYICSGIDYAAPTLGPLIDTPIRSWPPEEVIDPEGGE